MRRVGDRATSVLKTPVVAQFIKFGVVGVSNTLLFFAVYTLLWKAFGVWYVAASAIGFAVGATNGFLWNRAWTFKGHAGDALTPVRWFVVQATGDAANSGLIYLFVDGAGLGKLTGQALTIAIVMVLTFIANRSWTFRRRVPAALAESDG
jgi:putative flippase GtrA